MGRNGLAVAATERKLQLGADTLNAGVYMVTPVAVVKRT